MQDGYSITDSKYATVPPYGSTDVYSTWLAFLVACGAKQGDDKNSVSACLLDIGASRYHPSLLITALAGHTIYYPTHMPSILHPSTDGPHVGQFQWKPHGGQGVGRRRGIRQRYKQCGLGHVPVHTYYIYGEACPARSQVTSDKG